MGNQETFFRIWAEEMIIQFTFKARKVIELQKYFHLVSAIYYKVWMVNIPCI